MHPRAPSPRPLASSRFDRSNGIPGARSTDAAVLPPVDVAPPRRGPEATVCHQAGRICWQA